MRAQLLHLSGPSRGRTATYAVPLVTIGSDPTNTVYLPDPAVKPTHARIEWVQDDCSFHLHALDGQVFVNGTEVKEVILHEDDQIEFGVDGPRTRFRVYVPQGAVCKPVRRMFSDARAVGRVSGGAAATGALTRDLFTQASWKLRLGVPLVVLAVFFAGYFGSRLGREQRLEAARQTADMVTKKQLEEIERLHGELAEKLRQISAASDSVRRIQHEWSRGVCLIHGAYRFLMPGGEWFSLEDGVPFEPEYTGSGFLATPEGHIITNNHVVVPWKHEERLEPVLAMGAKPQFTMLSVTFPGHMPTAVRFDSIVTRDDDLDVAVVQVDPLAVEGVPVLPLEPMTEPGVEPYESQGAVVVGYPTGLGSLLVRADGELVADLQKRRASLAETIEALAKAGQIKPLITQGIIGSVEDRMLVYDAATTYGGSGGPVFGDRGTVIAVNFAIQQGFHGSNYGVPIRFARELLP